MKNNQTSELRHCLKCVQYDSGGGPVIDGFQARRVHKTNVRKCSVCGEFVKDFYHIPYTAPVQHELPRADVVFGDYRRPITGSKVG